MKAMIFMFCLNFRLMACTGLEEDIGDSIASGTKYDRNKETLMTISNVLETEGGTLPSLQLKMTAFMPAELLVKLPVPTYFYRSLHGIF